MPLLVHKNATKLKEQTLADAFGVFTFVGCHAESTKQRTTPSIPVDATEKNFYSGDLIAHAHGYGYGIPFSSDGR